MRRVGIYSGSFNPVHVGHIALAQFLVRTGAVDEVWMIRTPRNPLKASLGLWPDADRLAMLKCAVRGRKGLRVLTIEDALPQPNYTIVTLRTLKDHYPDCQFHLIIGADNWNIFDQWRDYDEILRDYHVIVYPRPGSDVPQVYTEQYPTVKVVSGAPLYDLSSTEVRRRVAAGLSIEGMVPRSVLKYINENLRYGIGE